jgi:hypothetical protein
VDVYQGVIDPASPKVESYEKMDILIYIEDGKISLTNIRGQFGSYRFDKSPLFSKSLYGMGIPGYKIDTRDLGGFECLTSIYYIKESDSYRIVFGYNNLTLYFYCNLTDERPWDNEYDLVKDAQSWPDDPDYTNQEVLESIRRMIEGIKKSL